MKFAIVAAGALWSAGCGGAAAGKVSGHVVRNDGAPLAGATLIARCDETGKSVYATTDDTGAYELSSQKTGDGTPVGTYHMSIMEKKADRDTISPPTISAKYADPTKSGLTFSVAANESKTFDVTVDRP